MVWIIISQPETILAYLPVYIAKEKLKFKIINTGNDNSAIEALKEKRADISIGDPFMFNEIDYKKVKIISGFISKPFIWIITFNSFLKNLNNKTIVSYPKPSTTYRYALQLQKKFKLNIIETPFNTEIGPLLTQEADIGFIMEPNYTQAIKNGAKTLISLIDKKCTFTGFCSIKKQPKFLNEIKKAIKIFYEDEEKTLKIAQKYFIIEKEVLKKAIENLRKNNIYNLEFTENEIRNACKLRKLNYNTIKKLYIKS